MQCRDLSKRRYVYNWSDEIKARGLTIAPEATVDDGVPGFWKALDEVFPSARHQRCWFRQISNNDMVLSRRLVDDCRRPP